MEPGAACREPDDEMFLYTGGTTGMPKAVVWRQCALIDLLAGNVTAASALDRHDPATILETVATARRLRSMPAAPMMHATGLLSQLANLMAGGCTVFPGGRSFDAARLLRAAADQRVNILVIVGDAMGRPIVEELDRAPDDVRPVGARRHHVVRNDVEPAGEGRAARSPPRRQHLRRVRVQ